MMDGEAGQLREEQAERLLHLGGDGEPAEGGRNGLKNCVWNVWNGKLKKRFTKFWLCTYSALFLLCALFIGGAFAATYFPTRHHDYSIGIYSNDTILVPIRPSQRVVDSLMLRVEECDSLAFALPCSKLVRRCQNVSMSIFDHPLEFLYLLEGSVIHFTYRDEEFLPNSSIYVWLFTDYNAYQHHLHTHENTHTCNHRSGSYCHVLSVNETWNFTVHNSSYYFINCAGYLGCPYAMNWTIDLCWYNYSDYLDVQKREVGSKQNTRVVLRNETFFSYIGHFANLEEMCLLLHITYKRFTCQKRQSTLTLSDIDISSYIWFFPALSGSLVIMLGIALTAHIIWCCKRPKQHAEPEKGG